MLYRGIVLFVFALVPASLAAQAIPYIMAPPVNGAGLINSSLNPKFKRSSSSSTVAVEPKVAATFSLNFIAVKSRTRGNLASFVSKTRAKDPQGAAQLEQLFSQTDVISAIGQSIEPYGLRTNNVADAYAVYWISAWEASRGIIGASETRQRAQAVKSQVANAILSTPAFAAATDAQKQEYAEAMFVQAALVSSVSEAYANDPEMSQRTIAAIKQGAKAMGLDLDTMDLTPNGFVPAKGRKRSDAGGAVDGDGAEGDAVLASNDTPTGDKAPANPLATYALIAAAGGAGLGGVFLIGKAMGKKG
jgi:hypothetical protein